LFTAREFITLLTNDEGNKLQLKNDNNTKHNSNENKSQLKMNEGVN
jgi:hypothetical protein